MGRKCVLCSAELPVGARFCEECGHDNFDEEMERARAYENHPDSLEHDEVMQPAGQRRMGIYAEPRMPEDPMEPFESKTKRYEEDIEDLESLLVQFASHANISESLQNVRFTKNEFSYLFFRYFIEQHKRRLTDYQQENTDIDVTPKDLHRQERLEIRDFVGKEHFNSVFTFTYGFHRFGGTEVKDFPVAPILQWLQENIVEDPLMYAEVNPPPPAEHFRAGRSRLTNNVDIHQRRRPAEKGVVLSDNSDTLE